MPQLLTLAELAVFTHVPETDLVDLAVDLDIPVGEKISREGLLDQAVQALARLARRDGLPLSAYDEPDLRELSPEHLGALAQAMGVNHTVQAVMRAGRKVFKRYRRDRSRSQIPLMLPMLLSAVARHLASPHQTQI